MSQSGAGNPLGAVLIGRNEGQRLIRALESVKGRCAAMVYVDSGSTDGSCEAAAAAGAEVVRLDMSVPFSAARARNEGYGRLRGVAASVRFVQFIDGDCEVDSGWWPAARSALEGNPGWAVVFGRLRERRPEASLYNRLCDLEWDTPIGESGSCGGNAMVRVEAFEQAGGYTAEIIAGEEPELCVRLRRLGWTIHRIDAEMALHDAAMTRFGQWWKRARRTGHAYAEGCWRHGRSPQRHYVRQTMAALLWGLALPLVALGLAWFTWGLSLLLLLGYALIGWRSYRWMRGRAAGPDARLWACFTTLAKLPQALGVLQFGLNRLRGRRSKIIEYKGPAGQGGPAEQGGSAGQGATA